MFGSNLTAISLVIPEISIIAIILVINLFNLGWSEKYQRTTYLIIQTTLLANIGVISNNFDKIDNAVPRDLEVLLQNGLNLNLEANLVKLVLVTFLLFWLVYVRKYLQQHVKSLHAYFSLSLLLLLSGMLLVSSNNFITFYFGVEMAIIALIGLIAISQTRLISGTIKYFMMNAIFSLLLLYGLSLIYGAIGSLKFINIIDFVQHQHIPGLFHAGVILVISAMLFKLGLFPFQAWVPDLYQQTPIAAMGFVAIFPILTVVGFYGYLVKNILVNYFHYNWQILAIILALISMLLGSLGSMFQVNLKRILGYGAISNAGMICLGVFTNKLEGITAANFTATIYAGMLLNILGVILWLRNQQINIVNIEDLLGLSTKKPIISAILLIILLAMLGAPPTAGFYAKFLLIKALIAADLTWVAGIALFILLLGGYSYLRIIKYIYTKTEDPANIAKDWMNVYADSFNISKNQIDVAKDQTNIGECSVNISKYRINILANLGNIVSFFNLDKISFHNFLNQLRNNNAIVSTNYAALLLLWFNVAWILLLGLRFFQ